MHQTVWPFDNSNRAECMTRLGASRVSLSPTILFDSARPVCGVASHRGLHIQSLEKQAQFRHSRSSVRRMQQSFGPLDGHDSALGLHGMALDCFLATDVAADGQRPIVHISQGLPFCDHYQPQVGRACILSVGPSRCCGHKRIQPWPVLVLYRFDKSASWGRVSFAAGASALRTQHGCAFHVMPCKESRQERQGIGFVARRIEFQLVTESYGLHAKRITPTPPRAKSRSRPLWAENGPLRLR